MASLDRMLIAVALASAVTGCTETAGELTVATYNLGLARGFVDLTDQRADTTIEATNSLDVDVMCVQEAWDDEHYSRIAGGLASTRRPAEPDEPDPEGPPACTSDELRPLRTCLENMCADVITDELVDCALAQCGPEVDELTNTNADCLSCLVSKLGADFEVIEIECTTGAGSYAYGGSFGSGILTNGTIVDEDSLLLDSELTRRAVLYARVDHDDYGEVDVFCTHLSPTFSAVPYPGETGSWLEEQQTQIDAVLAYVDQKAGSGRTLLIGDMNTGPAATNAIAEEAANYQKFLDAGFQNPYAEQADATCTFCGPNPLNDEEGGADHSDSVLIDHIFVRAIGGTFLGERVLDGTFQVTDEAGAQVETAYSDHYGVVLSIEE